MTKYDQQVAPQANRFGNLRRISSNISILEIELKFKTTSIFFCLIKWMENLCTSLCTFCVIPVHVEPTDCSKVISIQDKLASPITSACGKKILLISCHILATTKKKKQENG